VLLSGATLAAYTGATATETAAAPTGGDTQVSAGSPVTPFSQNKQNEPAVAMNPLHPEVLVAGANDNIDMEACNAGDDTTCPFTDGVGVSGVYFSFDSGATWNQPTYQGLTARNCLGTVGNDDPGCTPTTGPIGTLPNYDTAGLVSDGDPALAFGPAPKNGHFSWDNGARLYYMNLTAQIPGSGAFKGAEAIGVSYTDNLPAAASGDRTAWSAPVIASKQNAAKFSDKEQVWADNAAHSKYFGNVYGCYAAFRGTGHGFTNQPLDILRSTDGGNTWSDTQVTAASNSPNGQNGFGRSGCTVRTDSVGNAYVFVYSFGFGINQAAKGTIQMLTSTDGGVRWSKPVPLFTAYDTCSYFEPSIGRCVEDGVAGARSDLTAIPSVDIANGAPLGTDATNRMVMTWVDGRGGLNHEKVMFSTSTDGAHTWSTPRDITRPGDRGYYAAAAISPNGTDVYEVYNAWTTPFRNSAVGPGNDRELAGVVMHADAAGSGVGAFTEVHRGLTGDARGSSQNNLAAEFLGDYVYAAASRTYGAAVWNDMRDGADCPAMDQYRQALHDQAVSSGAATADAEDAHDAGTADATTVAPPAPQQDCPANWGNSSIYGGGYPDPTP
jgi:hypothetical protein